MGKKDYSIPKVFLSNIPLLIIVETLRSWSHKSREAHRSGSANASFDERRTEHFTSVSLHKNASNKKNTSKLVKQVPGEPSERSTAPLDHPKTQSFNTNVNANGNASINTRNINNKQSLLFQAQRTTLKVTSPSTTWSLTTWMIRRSSSSPSRSMRPASARTRIPSPNCPKSHTEMLLRQKQQKSMRLFCCMSSHLWISVGRCPKRTGVRLIKFLQ